MKRLIVALIAGSFAAAAAAQGTAPVTTDSADKAKAKQEMLKGATAEGEQKSGAQTAAEAKKATEVSKRHGKVRDQYTKEQRAKGTGAITKSASTGSTGAATSAQAQKATEASKAQPSVRSQYTTEERAKGTGNITKQNASQ